MKFKLISKYDKYSLWPSNYIPSLKYYTYLFIILLLLDINHSQSKVISNVYPYIKQIFSNKNFQINFFHWKSKNKVIYWIASPKRNNKLSQFDGHRLWNGISSIRNELISSDDRLSIRFEIRERERDIGIYQSFHLDSFAFSAFEKNVSTLPA